MKLRLLPLKLTGLVKVRQELPAGHDDGELSISWTENEEKSMSGWIENPLGVGVRVSPPEGDPGEQSHWEIMSFILTYPLLNIVIFGAESDFQVATLQLSHGDHMSGSNFIIMNDHGGLTQCQSYIIKPLKGKSKMTTCP